MRDAFVLRKLEESRPVLVFAGQRPRRLMRMVCVPALLETSRAIDINRPRAFGEPPLPCEPRAEMSEDLIRDRRPFPGRISRPSWDRMPRRAGPK